MTESHDVARYRANLQGEVDGAALYHALADAEPQPQLAQEEEELALIYQAKGLPEEQARALAKRLIANREMALDTLAREELGIDPRALGGSAWEAAITSFILFALGAVVPLAPFFFLTGTRAVIVSVSVSAVALFLIGAGITLLTRRGVMASGMGRCCSGSRRRRWSTASVD
jgi:VIT1/CCC1 family predicted Fe2+/Mn2+ transporter